MIVPNRFRLIHKNNSKLYYTVDISSSSIEIGRTLIKSEHNPREILSLGFPGQYNTEIKTRKVLVKDPVSLQNALNKFEQKLQNLSERGLLASTNIILGVKNDPFHPFKDRFDLSMRVLKILKKYRPGLLTIQTRSPIIVIGLDLLKSFEKNLNVNFYIETPDDEVAKKLTPEFPSPSERLRAALALKRFNIDTSIHVSPMLPYGNWQESAVNFAEILIKHANRIHISEFTNQAFYRKQINSVISRAISNLWGSHWLGPNSTCHLITAIKKLAPDKLATRQIDLNESKQLKMFVA